MSNTPTGTETDRSTGARRDTLNTDAMQWLSALIALIGLWLVAVHFRKYGRGNVERHARRNGYLPARRLQLLPHDAGSTGERR